MNKLGAWLFSAQCAVVGVFGVSEIVEASCGLGNINCSNYIQQDGRCMPGECYLYEELVDCSMDNYSCRDGNRRIWSFRPLFYAPNNAELLINLNKKLCPNLRECKWPYSLRDSY